MHKLAAVAPVLFALTSCGSKTTAEKTISAADPEATATASVASNDTPGVASGTQLPLTAQAFVDDISASDKFEIESARMVQGMGPGQPLTSITQMMLRDHQASTNALRVACNAAGGSVFPNDQKITEEQKAELGALRSAGADVGRIYVQQQVKAHRTTLAVLKNYAASGDNPALMAFATKAIALVMHHLQELGKIK